MYLGGGPRSVTRAVFQVLRQRQTDPELERLRREVWRHYIYMGIWYMGIWIYGFLVIVGGVLVLLAVTGFAH
jgi:hypothetical protein